MPSSPKVQKEVILQTALDMIKRDGYMSINIKTVAAELECSTQPISRQFGNMDGFRKELLGYCIGHLKDFFSTEGDIAADVVSGIAKGYISLAFDCPNLYKYLYMSSHEGEQMDEMVKVLRSEKYSMVVERLMREKNIPAAYVKEYLNNLNYYVHGIASYVAVGYIKESKEAIMDRVQRVSDTLLRNWKEMYVSEEEQACF